MKPFDKRSGKVLGLCWQYSTARLKSGVLLRCLFLTRGPCGINLSTGGGLYAELYAGRYSIQTDLGCCRLSFHLHRLPTH